MSYASINGTPASNLHLTVGWNGPWFCDVDIEASTNVSGKVTLIIGDSLALVGTVDTSRDGVFGDTRSVRIVGGANGWARSLPPRDYANDAGVKVESIAQHLAMATGETFGTLAPTTPRVGVHYTRRSGSAANTLVDIIGDVQWWVDYAGVTQVGARPASTPDPRAYAVVDYDARSGRAVISPDDLGTISPGSQIRVSDQLTVVARDVEIVLSAGERHVIAWCGPSTSGNRLAGMLKSIARSVADERIWGVYQYRVFRMSGDRVELQAVSKTAGLPDMLPIDQWHGAPGTHAILTPGAHVLVGFVEGDRSMPYIQSYVGKGGPGAAPVSLELGGPDGKAAARTGDMVRVTMPVGTFDGTISGAPAVGTITWVDPYAYGEIVGGSLVVRIK